MAEQSRSVGYLADRSGCGYTLQHEECRAEDCPCKCHDGMEYRFPYGWQVRESSDRSSSDG